MREGRKLIIVGEGPPAPQKPLLNPLGPPWKPPSSIGIQISLPVSACQGPWWPVSTGLEEKGTQSQIRGDPARVPICDNVCHGPVKQAALRWEAFSSPQSVFLLKQK